MCLWKPYLYNCFLVDPSFYFVILFLPRVSQLSLGIVFTSFFVFEKMLASLIVIDTKAFLLSANVDFSLGTSTETKMNH